MYCYRYKSVLPAKLVKLDPRTFCEALFRAIGIKGREFKFGQNKVFFKAGKVIINNLKIYVYAILHYTVC